MDADREVGTVEFNGVHRHIHLDDDVTVCLGEAQDHVHVVVPAGEYIVYESCQGFVDVTTYQDDFLAQVPGTELSPAEWAKEVMDIEEAKWSEWEALA
jgi:hypothetical protein